MKLKTEVIEQACAELEEISNSGEGGWGMITIEKAPTLWVILQAINGGVIQATPNTSYINPDL